MVSFTPPPIHVKEISLHIIYTQKKGRKQKCDPGYLVSIHVSIFFFFRLHSYWFDQVSVTEVVLTAHHFYKGTASQHLIMHY